MTHYRQDGEKEMIRKRVTIQEIADACNLSRNTVSKIFNNRGNVTESTRQFVMMKAQELGYYTQELPAPPKAAAPGSIAVLSSSNPLNHNFGALFIKAFTDAVCRSGYSVQMYELTAQEVSQLQLPSQMAIDNTLGVLCIELFDEAFIRHVSALGMATVAVDGYCGANRSMIPCDILSMENVTSAMRITKQMVEQGAGTLGFVGDVLHCNSFHERWGGFCAALRDAGIPVDRDVCILHPDGGEYADIDWTVAQLQQMPRLPEGFVCANDYHAVKLMLALKRMGLAIPGDVMVAGFDNTPESAIIEPGLTTVNIHSADMGVLAADVLLARLQSPQRPFCLTYAQTEPVFRSSTKKG